jgi:lysophospholipase L1-like esterase
LETAKKAMSDEGFSENMDIVDTWEVFLGKGNGDKPYDLEKVKDILSDGLHLAPKGNILLAEALMSTINQKWPELNPDNIAARVPWHDKLDVTDLHKSLFAIP